MTRFASPETYLHTPIEAFLPESPDWAEYGTRLLQQQGMDEVNEAQADLIRKRGDANATRIREGGASTADGIESRSNSQLWGSILNAGVSVAGAGFDAGWFGFKADPIGSMGNPFGDVSENSPIFGVPGGAAAGGGRVPLNG